MKQIKIIYVQPLVHITKNNSYFSIRYVLIYSDGAAEYSPLEWQYNIFHQAGRITFDDAIELIKKNIPSFEGIYLDNLAITEKRRRKHKAVDARDFYCRPAAGDTIYINGIKLKDVQDNMQYFSPVQQGIIKFLIQRRGGNVN